MEDGEYARKRFVLFLFLLLLWLALIFAYDYEQEFRLRPSVFRGLPPAL